MTELYAKLIGIVIVHFLVAPLRNPDITRAERSVSAMKFKKLLERFSLRLKQQLSDALLFTQVLDDFMTHVFRYALTQKRLAHPSTCSRLASLSVPTLA